MQICLSSTRARGISFLKMFVLLLTTLDAGLVVLSNPTSSHGTSGRLPVRGKMNLSRAVEKSRKGFLCKVPQERAYNLQDLMQSLNLQNPGESANQPAYVVLKRCDVHSGCCQSPDKSCSPKPSSTYYDDVQIELWSVEAEKGMRKQWIRVEQHGECSCEVTNSSERQRLETQKPNVTVLR